MVSDGRVPMVDGASNLQDLVGLCVPLDHVRCLLLDGELRVVLDRKVLGLDGVAPEDAKGPVLKGASYLHHFEEKKPYR